MHIMNFDDFCTDWKPWISAFNRSKNHQNWTSISKVMAISKCSLRSLKFRINLFFRKKHPSEGKISRIYGNSDDFFIDFSSKFEIAITFDADVQFWWFLYRSKAESQGFQSVQKSSKFNICVKSYSNFEKSPRIRWPAFLKKPGGGEAGFFKKANYH